MCETKDEVKTKLDRLIEGMERLTRALEGSPTEMARTLQRIAAAEDCEIIVLRGTLAEEPGRVSYKYSGFAQRNGPNSSVVSPESAERANGGPVRASGPYIIGEHM